MFTLNNLREYYLDLSVVEHFRTMQREAVYGMLCDFSQKLTSETFSVMSDVQQHLIISTLIKHNVLKTEVEPDAMNRPIETESPAAFFNLETELPYED